MSQSTWISVLMRDKKLHANPGGAKNKSQMRKHSCIHVWMVCAACNAPWCNANHHTLVIGQRTSSITSARSETIMRCGTNCVIMNIDGWLAHSTAAFETSHGLSYFELQHIRNGRVIHNRKLNNKKWNQSQPIRCNSDNWCDLLTWVNPHPEIQTRILVPSKRSFLGKRPGCTRPGWKAIGIDVRSRLMSFWPILWKYHGWLTMVSNKCRMPSNRACAPIHACTLFGLDRASSVHCAADNNHRSLRMVAPQKCTFCGSLSETWCGNWPGLARIPPMT